MSNGMDAATDAVNQWIISDELRASAWADLALEVDLLADTPGEAELLVGILLRLTYAVGPGRAELPAQPAGEVDWQAIGAAIYRGIPASED